VLISVKQSSFYIIKLCALVSLAFSKKSRAVWLLIWQNKSMVFLICKTKRYGEIFSLYPTRIFSFIFLGNFLNFIYIFFHEIFQLIWKPERLLCVLKNHVKSMKHACFYLYPFKKKSYQLSGTFLYQISSQFLQIFSVRCSYNVTNGVKIHATSLTKIQ